MDRIPSIPAELLQKAFDCLPPSQQQLLMLVRIDGLTCAEVGERMGLRPCQVERLLARALAALDRQLERLKWHGSRHW